MIIYCRLLPGAIIVIPPIFFIRLEGPVRPRLEKGRIG